MFGHAWSVKTVVPHVVHSSGHELHMSPQSCCIEPPVMRQLEQSGAVPLKLGSNGQLGSLQLLDEPPQQVHMWPVHSVTASHAVSHASEVSNVTGVESVVVPMFCSSEIGRTPW